MLIRLIHRRVDGPIRSQKNIIIIIIIIIVVVVVVVIVVPAPFTRPGPLVVDKIKCYEMKKKSFP